MQEPFLATGLSLGIPNSSATSIEQVDNVIFLDEHGNLCFKDKWVQEVLQKQAVTLQDLFTQNKGVFVRDGKLYFKDSSVSREYSLEEIVKGYTDIKNKFVNGGIFWIGRTVVDSTECSNVIVNINGDVNNPINADNARIYTKINGAYPNDSVGTEVFSIDKYIEDTVFESGDYKTDGSGGLRWHSFPNLRILIPPMDSNKVVHIFAKLNVRLINARTGIIFRLKNLQTNQVLDSISISNSAINSTSQQPTLTYVGKLISDFEEIVPIKCDCGELTEQELEELPHNIVVEFAIFDKQDDDIIENEEIKYSKYEARLFGIPTSNTGIPITTASIDCIIFDVTKEDKVGRKSGTLSLTNVDFYNVTFENPFSSNNYSISLSSNKNINMFYTNKKKTGFTIRMEKKFTGTVDWVATKLNFEGNA